MALLPKNFLSILTFQISGCPQANATALANLGFPVFRD